MSDLIEKIAKTFADETGGFGYADDITVAKAALRAIDEAGYAVVPKEPTGDMDVAGGNAQQKCIGSWGEPSVVFHAMINAAPDITGENDDA